jgi:hypothetical protein
MDEKRHYKVGQEIIIIKDDLSMGLVFGSVHNIIAKGLFSQDYVLSDVKFDVHHSVFILKENFEDWAHSEIESAEIRIRTIQETLEKVEE